MKCYKHIEEEAVAQCSRCGKFLCKECTTKYKGIICDECVESLQQKQEQDERRFAELEQMNKDENERKWFARATISMAIAFIVVLIFGMLAGSFIGGIIFALFFSCFVAGYVYGWNSLEDNAIIDSLLEIPFVGVVIHFFARYFLTGIVGFLLYLKKLISMLVSKK